MHQYRWRYSQHCTIRNRVPRPTTIRRRLLDKLFVFMTTLCIAPTDRTPLVTKRLVLSSVSVLAYRLETTA